jgi:hypothetical protein
LSLVTFFGDFEGDFDFGDPLFLGDFAGDFVFCEPLFLGDFAGDFVFCEPLFGGNVAGDFAGDPLLGDSGIFFFLACLVFCKKLAKVHPSYSIIRIN